MDLIEAIKNRRSVRRFTDKKVDQELIEKIIEAGQWAPSHCNTQAWYFIVIKDEKIKEKIIEAGGAPTIKNAPLGIMALYKNVSENIEYQDDIQSGAAAIQNMLLAAHSLGLAGCWICHLPKKSKIKQILSIPKNFNPIAYLLVGYPAKNPIPVKRKNKISQIISYNRFGGEIKSEPKTKIRLKRFLKKLYYSLPNPIKKAVSPLVNKFLVKKFNN